MDEQTLKKMLSEIQPLAPSKAVQDQAVKRAMAEFDKNAQGFSVTRRLTGIVNNIGRTFMQKRYVLSGAVSALALVTVLGVPFVSQQVEQVIAPNRQETDTLTPPLPASTATETITAVSTGDEKTRALAQPAKEEAEPPMLPVPSPTPMMDMMMERGITGYSAATGGIAYAPSMDMSMMAAMPAEGMFQGGIMPPDLQGQNYYKDIGRDKFTDFEENTVKKTSAEPVSTFSIDVDTSSYSFMRRMINQGVLPQKDAVRIEELINYFDYDYAVPAAGEEPFKPAIAVYDSPWTSGNKLIHIGIKGHEITEKPQSNLVFLIDTSGSMNSPDKLPLLVNSLRMSLDSLLPDDTVGIVVYAGSAGTVLEPTKVSDKKKIIAALERLNAGGGTAGAEGIRQAYALAEQAKVKGGNNRIILATDGDFNIGITNPEELQDFVERKRNEGIGLSVLGFGEGNYNDAMMQTLAQNGNGNAAYIDSLNEARKVLVEEASSTLFTIAKDVKIQVEFNPAIVQEYRLIGYETRRLNREDFNNDKVDAGEIGAGHAVTAIYEITPAGARPLVDDLRYDAAKKETAAPKNGGEYAFLKIRYKKPDGDVSSLITRPITSADEKGWNALPDDIRFAGTVAGFGQLLKGSKFAGTLTYDQVIEMANAARSKDAFGYRTEFINLVRLAKTAKSLEAHP